MAVTDHAYLPKTEDITSDWVAYIAAPAFKRIRENLGHDVEAFASIGTGSGIDVLTGIELLGAKRVGFTDLQKSVVTAAAENIKKNLKNADSIELEFGAGDLLQPLEHGKRRYDVVYENLPNVPLTDNTKIEDNRNSGHYLEKRVEVISGYAAQEKAGLGPFRFYRASDLQKAFADISVEESGKNAFKIEKSLESSKLTAKEAYEAFLKGEVIGHTVAVLKSSVK